MGKFNLNQILNNASRQAAEGGNTPPRPAESEIKKISVFDLVPSEDNFYSMREIEELKAAIEIAGKVLQNLTVVPLDGGKYKVIAGHRRRLASLALVEDGKPQYECNEQRKLKKQRGLLDKGKITLAAIEQSYGSWRSHAAKGNCHHLIRETDRLFKKLFKESVKQWQKV